MSAPIATSCRVAAIQMISGPDVDANLRQADELLAEAAARGARLAVLPEYFCLIAPDETTKVRLRETEGCGPLQDFLQDAARRHGLWIAGGTVPLVAQDAAKVRNTTLLYRPDGERAARYDKIHLFGFQTERESYNEGRTIEAGGEVVVTATPAGRTGLAVCYDLRFPELFRRMGEIDLLLLPAAFTATTGAAHWEVLLRARAIENQCYVLASAQGGTHPHGRQTFGHSMFIDPWGTVLDSLAGGAGVVLGEVDPARIAEVRASLPALAHRRFT